jgi:hypothetical protein
MADDLADNSMFRLRLACKRALVILGLNMSPNSVVLRIVPKIQLARVVVHPVQRARESPTRRVSELCSETSDVKLLPNC